MGFVVANWIGIKNYGEKKIVGDSEDGEGVSLRVQRTDARKTLRSVRKTNTGSNVIVLGGEKSYLQNKETNKKTRIKHEQGQCVMYVWVQVKEGEVAKETEWR